MSVQAITWVFEHSQATGNDRLVLLAIADAASREGEASMQSVPTLARMSRASESTVRRAIKALLESGEIEFVGQSSARYKHTNIYRMPGVSKMYTENAYTDGTPVKMTPPPLSPVTPNPTTNPNKNSLRSDAALCEPEWSEFWSLYPYKRGKQAAKLKWNVLMKRGVSPACIITGLRAQVPHLAAEKNRDDGNFCPYPERWLHGGRWDDEITPRRDPNENMFRDFR